MASVEKRGNVFRIRVFAGRAPNGKQKFKTLKYEPDLSLTPAKQEKAARKYADEYEERLRNVGFHDSWNMTFYDFVEKVWKPEYATKRLTPRTLEDYNRYLDKKIIPVFGKMKIGDIKKSDVSAFYNSLLKNGAKLAGDKGAYSKGSATKYLNILKSVFTYASAMEYIENSPCDIKTKYLSQAQDPADTVKCWNLEQTKRFLEYMSEPYDVVVPAHDAMDDTGKPYHVPEYKRQNEIPLQIKNIITLALCSALRKGELVALEWSDIDFDKKTLSVTKSVKVVKGKSIIGPPKTKTSIRTLILPDFMIELLKKQHLEQAEYRFKLGKKWRGDNWVFIQSDGSRMNYSTPYCALMDIIARYNKAAAEDAKIPQISFHGLRHTSATLLIADNVDCKVVSSRLGHAQTSTTMNIYVHALEEMDKKAAEVFETTFADEFNKKRA